MTRLMPMKNPAHPGAVVRDSIESLGLTVSAAAEALGITRQQLSRLVNEQTRVTPELALILEKGVGSTADCWMRIQAAYDLAQVRRRRRARKPRRAG